MTSQRRGITAIAITFAVSIVFIALAVGLIFILTSETKEVGFRAMEKKALYIAEGGAEWSIANIQTNIISKYDASKSVSSVLSWLDGLESQQIFTDQAVGDGTFIATVTDVADVPGENRRKLTISSTGKFGQVEKTVSVDCIFGFAASRVFDNAYFINNYGWLWGGAQIFQGDLRANGAFSVRGAQRVNGDVYASSGIDTSQGSLFYDDLARYYSTASNRARPGDPPYPGGPEFPGGYDGFEDMYDASGYPRDPANPQLHPNQNIIDMPYLGDLSYYQSLASGQNGTISQNGQVLVNNTYNGTISLIGTTANPIVINGPVVVTEDVIIKGVVEGQGSIYTGRNIHVIGDVTYKNPPSWPKPDYNPQGTAASNIGRDFLGLCSKGNVIIGNYKWSGWNICANYLAPPFTQPYIVDPSDAGIGYVSYYQGGDPYFNGNYTAYDGGTKSDGSQRKYYESSLSDSAFASLGPVNQVGQIDALVYTNHAISGRVSNMKFNGSVIGRDEAIAFQGYIMMNYDYRVKENGIEFVDIQLPISVMQPQKVKWSK
ncbi:MAG: hypothetical protein ABIA63_01140 [bacterium]